MKSSTSHVELNCSKEDGLAQNAEKKENLLVFTW